MKLELAGRTIDRQKEENKNKKIRRRKKVEHYVHCCIECLFRISKLGFLCFFSMQRISKLCIIRCFASNKHVNNSKKLIIFHVTLVLSDRPLRLTEVGCDVWGRRRGIRWESLNFERFVCCFVGK